MQITYYVCNGIKEFYFLIKHFKLNLNSNKFHITEHTKIWSIESVDTYGYCSNKCEECESISKEKCTVYKNIDNKIYVKDLINQIRQNKLERICLD